MWFTSCCELSIYLPFTRVNSPKLTAMWCLIMTFNQNTCLLKSINLYPTWKSTTFISDKRKKYSILMTFTFAVLVFISYITSHIKILVGTLLPSLIKPIIRKLLLTFEKHDQFILTYISKSCLTVQLLSVQWGLILVNAQRWQSNIYFQIGKLRFYNYLNN